MGTWCGWAVRGSALCLLPHRLSLPTWPSRSSSRTWVTGRSGCTASRWPFRRAASAGSPGRGCWPQRSSCRPWPTPDSASAIWSAPSNWVTGLGLEGPGLAERPGSQLDEVSRHALTSVGFQAHEICRHLRKPALENLVLSVLFRSAFLKKKY